MGRRKIEISIGWYALLGAAERSAVDALAMIASDKLYDFIISVIQFKNKGDYHEKIFNFIMFFVRNTGTLINYCARKSQKDHPFDFG